MAGHSKWAQIKHQKGVADKKRAALFTRLSNAITIASREGGGDPDSNFKLRMAIDQAKSANMPKDNIERAIKRGTGQIEGGQLDEIVYEAIGPGGVGIVIKTLTDNKNRTVATVKHILTKNSGSLAGQGAVLWQFEEKGVLRMDKKNIEGKFSDVDEFTLYAIDEGADDVVDDDESIAIYTSKSDLENIKNSFTKKGIDIEYSAIEFVPKNKTDIDDSTKSKLEKMFEAFDEEPDINDYYHNANV